MPSGKYVYLKLLIQDFRHNPLCSTTSSHSVCYDPHAVALKERENQMVAGQLSRDDGSSSLNKDTL